MLHCSTCDSVSKFLTTLAFNSLTGKDKVNECTQPFLVKNLQKKLLRKLLVPQTY